MKRKATTSTVVEQGDESSVSRRRSTRSTTYQTTIPFHSLNRLVGEPPATKRSRTSPPSAGTPAADGFHPGGTSGDLVPRRQRGQPRDRARDPKPGSSKTKADNSSPTERGLDSTLRPINSIRDIFGDLVETACTLGLASSPLFGNQRPIRIATMCSGTESPLLACRLISKELKTQKNVSFLFDHLFSAEIVAYKQAYIEKNFQPKILFRDITQLTERDTASTAYGAFVAIPGKVDVLIAGFSCVDFSRLNQWPKNLSDIGESGDTFRGILKYAMRYRPRLIILENVMSAPWEELQAIWRNDVEYLKEKTKREWESIWPEGDKAYAAHFVVVDTKNYYLPQTRQRGYMICIDRQQCETADGDVERWGELMIKLRRPASSPVEAFLLHSEDARLHRAREELTGSGTSKSKTSRVFDWTLCQARYQRYRNEKDLGNARPMTNWVNGGSCRASDFWWQDWTRVQVERLWDTFEICFLRNALRNIDPRYKSRFWELSQNVDRFTDTAPPGIIGCLTPSGIPFATSRGGPITGLEAMSLQGLPIDQLLLTRESQKELLDLAGNAMSSTVVGAAILASLIAGSRALKIDNDESEDEQELDATWRDMPEPYREMDQRALGSSKPLNLLEYSQDPTKVLHELARNSIRLCYCEGPDQIIERPILVCRECNHTACQYCAGIPPHSYQGMNELAIRSRIKPSEFVKAIKAKLPMRLQLTGLDYRTVEHFVGSSWNATMRTKYLEAIQLTLGEELRFQAVTRTHKWVITYEARNSQLSLTFSEHRVFWQLNARPNAKESANSELRKLLMQPFASMQVDNADHLFSGRWKFLLPTTKSVDLSIDGLGELTKCWESKLGLQDPAVVDKQVWPRLQISVHTEKSSQLGNEVSGKYQLLQNCGTACGNLHKKVSDESPEEPVYLFLDPDRYGKPENDCFVFSKEINRLAYEETRTIIASMDPSWRANDRISDTTTCQLFGAEFPCEAQLEPFATHESPTFEVLSENIDDVLANDLEINSSLPMDSGNSCVSKAHTILSCKVPLGSFEDLGWEQGWWRKIDQIQERQTFAMFTWLTERVRTLSGFSARWRELKSPGTSEICQSCAPRSPDIKWRIIGSSNKFIPFEDKQQAGAFERSIKARPAPFITYTRIDDEQRGCLMIGLNTGTLVHRALAKFSLVAGDEGVKVSWRLDSQYEWPIKTSYPAFELKSNKTDAEKEHVFKAIPEFLELRREQRRSLAWMLRQESRKAPIFYEQETEEALLASIGWRAEVRAVRPSKGRGGVLTDEVGYGKTVTTLALIARRMQSAIESTKIPRANSIPVQATLIIVPKTLIAQWTRQIQKFLGQSCIFVVIKTMTDLNSLSVKKVKEAHIVLMAWSIFSSQVYPPKIGAFAAMPEGPVAGGRAFKSWIEEASKRVGSNTNELKNCQKVAEFRDILSEKLAENIKENEVQQSVPTNRLRGAAYVKAATKAKGKKSSAKPSANSGSIIDSFKLSEASCLDEMKAPPLQMFHFHRLVVDEYTYVSAKEIAYVNSFKSTYRWVLSGTPRLGDFADVKVLAGFLGVHLGEDDDCSSILQSYNLKQLRENRTATEQFRAFSEPRSPAWHLQRHRHAQNFLDHFARKNVAEIGVIPLVESLRVVTLPSTQRALFMELQQQLEAQDMRIIRGGRSRTDGDRVKRINQLLRASKSAEEALLKCAAFFVLDEPTADFGVIPKKAQLSIEESSEESYAEDSSENRASDAEDISEDSADAEETSGQIASTNEDGAEDEEQACDLVIRTRNSQYQDLSNEFETHLRHAVWLSRQCDDPPEGAKPETHFRSWKAGVHRNELGDPDGTAELVRLIGDAEQNYSYGDEDEFYVEKPTEEEIRKQKLFLKKKKAKEAAAKKREALKKKTGKGKADDEAETSASDIEENAGDDAGGHAVDDDLPLLNDPRAFKIAPGDHSKFVQTLRILTGHLRVLARELVSRVRALRFLKTVKKLQVWQSEEGGEAIQCQSCPEPTLARQDPNPSDIRVLGLCGHVACVRCLIREDRNGHCLVENCKAPAEEHHIHPAEDFNRKDDLSVRYGAKLDAIIDLIKSIPEADQVLLFVQFEDLMRSVARALDEEDITYYAIYNSQSKNAGEEMDLFQQDVSDQRKKVLVLNPSNESAAGINLTNANHVIFVAPLLAETSQEYFASWTQCVGRARRYGQQKTVFVYQFLALKTVDIDIFQDRMGKRLVNTVGNEYKAIDEKLLDESQLAVNWGTGRVKRDVFNDDDW